MTQNHSRLLLLCAAPTVASLLACGTGETDRLLPGRDIGALPDTLAPLPASEDRSFRPRSDTGDFEALVLASEEGLESTVYLRFDLTSLADTAGLLHADLGLRLVKGRGGPYRVIAHTVSASAPDWTEHAVPLDGLPIDEPPFFGTLGTLSPAEGETLFVTDAVTLPPELIQSWRTDPDANRGIALKLDPTRPGVLRALAREATPDTGATVVNPRLEIFRTDAASVLLEPSEDAYRLIDQRPSEDPITAPLFLEQEVPWEGLLRFDLAGLPLRSGDTVHRAELVAHVVPGSMASGDSMVVTLYRNFSDWSESGAAPDTVDTERFGLDLVIVEEADAPDTLRWDLGPAVQDWVNGEENFGLTLRPFAIGEGEARVQLYSREAEPALRPTLVIVYSPASDPRWGGVQ